MDLKTYAANHARTGGAPCSTCKLSEELRGHIKSGREAGYSWPLISAWLKAIHGVNIKPNSLRVHNINHEEA